MVNHFKLDNNELIDRLVEVVESAAYCSVYEDDDGYQKVLFSSSHELATIKQELLSRLK